jgi:nucleoside-diphosphate-sugar epimerase
MRDNVKERVSMSDHSKSVAEVEHYLGKVRLQREMIEYYKGRSVLVTGGAGAVGSCLILALAQLAGTEGMVVVFDNLSAGKAAGPWNVAPLPNIMFVPGDIRNDDDLKRVFKDDPTMVFHLAGFSGNQKSVDYPGISAEVDVLGLIQVLEYSRLAGVEKFVYASSGSAVCGSYPVLPLREDCISMNLTTPCEINKMTGEMYCNFYQHHYGLRIVNCRFFNSYGPGDIPGQYRRVIANFIYWSMKGCGLPITGTGEETRDFAYVLDLVQGLIRAGYEPAAVRESLNLASGKEIRIKDLAGMVNAATGNRAGVHFRERRKWDTKPRLLASFEKARRLIGYEPLSDFDEGLRSTVEWFWDNWDKIEACADFPPGINSALRGVETNREVAIRPLRAFSEKTTRNRS